MFYNPWYGNNRWEDAASTSDELQRRIDFYSRSLKAGWTIHVNRDYRLYYCNHVTRTSSWIPPVENWYMWKADMPYGWESALDRDGKRYFINHVNRTTTYENPCWDLYEDPPEPREVELTRDPNVGFGFVAGSEKPVIVRFITEEGPSDGKLFPGDQIMKVNGEDVYKSPRSHIIRLVKSCSAVVRLTVCQPPLDNTTRKSAILSPAKKAKLKSHRSKVRFAEGFATNDESHSIAPNVLKVFLENGQMKSFKYDCNTRVKEVLLSLFDKLGIRRQEHFALAVELTSPVRRKKVTLLDEEELLVRMASRADSSHLRCLFRVAFVPKDAYDLLQADAAAFEYLYKQCCNDIVQEKFFPELKCETALRLAALHMHELYISSDSSRRPSLRNIEQEYGLDKFIPLSLRETMKTKEMRKLLSHFLKLNQNLCLPNQHQLSSLQAKLHYLKIVSELPSYGAKCFCACFDSSSLEEVIVVSPKYGLSHISSVRGNAPVHLMDIESLCSLYVYRKDDVSLTIELRQKDPDCHPLCLIMEDRQAHEFVLVIKGYHFTLTRRCLVVESDHDPWNEIIAPPYHGQHKVEVANWNFVIVDGDEEKCSTVDLSFPPPYRPAKNINEASDLSTSTASIKRFSSPIHEFESGCSEDLQSTACNNLEAETEDAERDEIHFDELRENSSENGSPELNHHGSLHVASCYAADSENSENDSDYIKQKNVGPELSNGSSFDSFNFESLNLASLSVDDEGIASEKNVSLSPLEPPVLQHDVIDLTRILLPKSAESNASSPSNSTLEAVVSSDPLWTDDIDSFIASTSVLPPPRSSVGSEFDVCTDDIPYVPPPPPMDLRFCGDETFADKAYAQHSSSLEKHLPPLPPKVSLPKNRMHQNSNAAADTPQLSKGNMLGSPKLLSPSLLRKSRNIPVPRETPTTSPRLSPRFNTSVEASNRTSAFNAESNKISPTRVLQVELSPRVPSSRLPRPSDSSYFSSDTSPPCNGHCQSNDHDASRKSSSSSGIVFFLRNEHGEKCSRFLSPEQMANGSVAELDCLVSSLDASIRSASKSVSYCIDRATIEFSKEPLVFEIRQFVTASKLFVRSTTESVQQFERNMEQCVSILSRIASLTQKALGSSAMQSDVLDVARKIRQVALCFKFTVEAAGSCFKKPIDDPRMTHMISEASKLASSLTCLLQTLKAVSSELN